MIKGSLVLIKGFLILLIQVLGFGLTTAQFRYAAVRQHHFGSTKPAILSFTKSDFQSDSHFNVACEANDGTMLFGNFEGAVSYDGHSWRKIFLPNNSSIYSLVKSKNGEIYAGGYNDFGVLKKDQYGKYVFHSMVNQLKLSNRNFETIWRIHCIGSQVIFMSYNELIVVNKGVATIIRAPKSFLYGSQIGNSYFIQDSEKGILSLNLVSKKLESAFSDNYFNNEITSALLPTQNPLEILIMTRSGKIFLGNIQTRKVVKVKEVFAENDNDQLNCGIRKEGNRYLLGTLSTKLLWYDLEKNQISSNADFQNVIKNNPIIDLFVTFKGNLWILENNGLNFFSYNSTYQNIFDKASVFDILIKNKKIYLATNQGIFYADVPQEIMSDQYDFKPIPKSKGQAWMIQCFDDDIIASHNNGLLKIRDNGFENISTQSGFWKLTPIPNKVGWYLGSNYNGLFLVRKQNGQWMIRNKIEGFNESTRDIAPDSHPNTYWVCHGYKGVFRIRIDSDYQRVEAVEHYTNTNGFVSPFNINVHNYQGKAIFTTNTGIYQFDETTNSFVLHHSLNKILNPQKNVRKIIETKDKIWAIEDDELGYFTEKNPTFEKNIFLNLKGTYNKSMESILPFGTHQVFVGTHNGLFLYDTQVPKQPRQPLTQISRMSYLSNQVEQELPINNSHELLLPNGAEVVRIEFAVPLLISNIGIQYRYKLENTDNDWSNWTSNSFKEYTNLTPGNYVFSVEARNLLGVQATEAKIKFTIKPKWYQTTVAYFIYVILCMLLLKYVYLFIKQRFEQEHLKTRNEIEKSKKLVELELEQLKLKEDKAQIYKYSEALDRDIILKSKELANYTLLLSQKTDIFQEIKTDLQELKSMLRSDESKKKLLEIYKKLNAQKIGNDFIEIFDVNFEKVNHEFFQKLKQLSPELSQRELRLCAFVKMNFSNKQISPLLGISARGVETARLKIRKKLHVPHEETLSTFLEKLV